MNEYPELISDIEFVKEKDNVIILGSSELNCYIKLRCKSQKAIEQLIALFDGKHSVIEIENYCKEKNININMSNFISELSKNGLFINDGTKKQMNNEIDMLSIKLFEKKFNHYKVSNRNYTRAKYVITILNICLAAIFLYAFIYLKAVIKIFNLKMFTYQNSYLSALLITYVLSTLSLFLHELGHVLFGTYRRLGIEKIGIYLYLGFMPKWTIKFRSMQIAPKKDKLIVLFGGMYINLFLSGISIFLCILNPSNEIFKCFIVSNILLIFNCLSPFKLTDGYFIFSILLGINNWRLTMLKNLKKLGKIEWNRYNIINYIYMCINVLFYVAKIFVLYYWMTKSLLEITKFSYVIIAIMAIIHIFIIGKKIKKSII